MLKTYFIAYAYSFIGDITSVTVLGKTIVTVHTYEKAVELLHTKSLLYSSRPESQMFFLGGWKDNVPFVPYNSL